MPPTHSRKTGRLLAAVKPRTQRLAERLRRVASRSRKRQRRILAGVDARLSLQETSPLVLLARWEVPAAPLEIARELLSERGALLVLRIDEVPPVRPIPGQGASWWLEEVVAGSSGSRRIELDRGVGLIRGRIGLKTARGLVLFLGTNGPAPIEESPRGLVPELPQSVATAEAVVEQAEELEDSESGPSGSDSVQTAPQVLPWVGFRVQDHPEPEGAAPALECASPDVVCGAGEPSFASASALEARSHSSGAQRAALAEVLGIAVAAAESSSASSWGGPPPAGAIQLDLHAEVVVWGRAPSGLRVWVSGVEVPVRADGSFEARFAMPRSLPPS